MRLTRSQSIVIATGTILLFFGIATILVQGRGSIPVKSISSTLSGSTTELPLDDKTAHANSLIPKSEVVLNRFHRSEVKDGKKLWEVEALEGRYLPESASIELEKAKLWVYQKSGETVSLEAAKAHLFLSGQELMRAETSGGVRVDRDGKISLETDTATYLRQESVVKAPGFVQIRSDTLNVSGIGLEVNLETEEIKLNAEVSSIVQPKAHEAASEAAVSSKD